jgi:hypothetical protein
VVGEVDGVVLIRSFDRDGEFLTGYDGASGAERWRTAIEDHLTAHIENAGVVSTLIPNRNGSSFMAGFLDPGTGARRDEHVVELRRLAPPITASGLVVSILQDGPAGSGTAVQATDDRGLKWSRSDIGIPDGEVLLADHETVLVTTLTDATAASGVTTRALDLATGADRWQAPGRLAALAQMRSPTGTPDASRYVRSGTVFAVDGDHIDARSTSDGTTRWTMSDRPADISQRQTQGAPSDLVLTNQVVDTHFDVRELATGRVVWSVDNVVAAGPDRLLTYGLGLYDIHTGKALATLSIPCLHDPACTLGDSYLERVAMDGAVTVLAVNDFNGG